MDKETSPEVFFSTLFNELRVISPLEEAIRLDKISGYILLNSESSCSFPGECELTASPFATSKDVSPSTDAYLNILSKQSEYGNITN